jgi:hypothetical protein
VAFTDHCDVFGSLHEAGINRVVRHIMLQRPSLFNYGTYLFAQQPDLLCERIERHPEVDDRGNPILTVEDPLPVPGTNGLYGFDFCVQIVKLEIDFHPGNVFALPPELNPPLEPQRLALRLTVCAAIVCPDDRGLEDIVKDLETRDREDQRKDDRDQPRPPPKPLPRGKPICFCIDVFGVAQVTFDGPSVDQRVRIGLMGLEIVDIRPDELETSLECVLATTLRLAVLPRTRIPLDFLTLKLGDYGSLSLAPTPISANVPHNPAIEDDRLAVRLDLTVAP